MTLSDIVVVVYVTESDAVSTSVDCSVLNGGCEYTCVPGSPHHCTCPAGLTLSPSNLTCVGKNTLT